MMNRIPVPVAVELPDDEAWRALFEEFGVLDDQPTMPMPLEPETEEAA